MRVSNSRQHKCASCDENLFHAKCTAKKTYLKCKDLNALIVIHEGTHNHSAERKVSSQVVDLVTDYFKKRPDANRMQAANDLISNAIMTGNHSDIVRDILVLYSRQENFNKIRDLARKDLLDAKHGSFSSVKMFLNKFEGSEWGLHNIIGSHAKYCPNCKQKTFDDQQIKYCAKCKNVPLKEVGEIIFQTTEVGMKLLAETEEGKTHDIECLYLGKDFKCSKQFLVINH